MHLTLKSDTLVHRLEAENFKNLIEDLGKNISEFTVTQVLWLIKCTDELIGAYSCSSTHTYAPAHS